MKKLILTIITIFTFSLPLQAAEAYYNTEIRGIETTSKYGHVLNYVNTNENLEKASFMSHVGEWRAGSYNYHTLAPEDDTQLIKKGTLKLEVGIDDTKTSLAEIYNQFNTQIKLHVTIDGINYEEVTDKLNDDGVYEEGDNLRGYYLEYNMISDMSSAGSAIKVFINHEIIIDYSKLTNEQLLGTESLENWLDTKFYDTAPTPADESIFIINPEISGTIISQILADEIEIPVWDQATAVANIPVSLLKEDGTLVASTTTDIDGNFIFSNALTQGTAFSLDNSLEKLYLSIDGQGKKEWREVTAIMEPNVDDLPLGNIIDMSRSQATFKFSISKTSWKLGYSNYNPEGKNALGSKYILTEVSVPSIPETTSNNDEITEDNDQNLDTLVATGNNAHDLLSATSIILLIVSILLIKIKKYLK